MSFGGPKTNLRERATSLPADRVDGGSMVLFGRKRCLVYPPSGWAPDREALQEPPGRLEREHVFGMNGGARGGVHFVGDGRCVYTAARLCVVEDLRSPQQQHFEGHSAEVTCLAYCGARDLAISGQADPPGSSVPYACVWCPSSPSRALAELCYYVPRPQGSRLSREGLQQAPPRRTVPPRDTARYTFVPQVSAAEAAEQKEHELCAITAVAIAPHGRNACMLCDDSTKLVCVYSLHQLRVPAPGGPCPEKTLCLRQPEAVCAGGGDAVSLAIANPFDQPSSFRFACVSSKQLKFWHYSEKEKVLASKILTFGKCQQAAPTYFCYGAEDGRGLLACKNGHVYTTSGTSCVASAPVLAAAAGCVAQLPGGKAFLALGADGSVVLGQLGDPSAKPKVRWRATAGELADASSDVGLRVGARPRWNSLALGGAGLALLGSEGHCLALLQLAEDGGAPRLLRVLQAGHPGEAWALAPHPTIGGLWATGDSHGVVSFWDTARRVPLPHKGVRCDSPVWSLDFSPEGDLFALGCDKGFVCLLTFPGLERVAKRLCKRPAARGQRGSSVDPERIALLKFSPALRPDGQRYLAAGSWDQNVYLLKTSQEKRAREAPAVDVQVCRVLGGNSSSPTQMMFSADGQFLISNSRDAQILIWKVSSGERLHSLSVTRDLSWTQWTCVLGWPVAGVWRPEYDLTDINAVCQSSPEGPGGEHFIAVGDDLSTVLLYRFPSPCAGAAGLVYTGHASHVTSVRFDADNTLVSLGGGDHTLQQWRLVADAPPRGGAPPTRPRPSSAARRPPQPPPAAVRHAWASALPEQPPEAPLSGSGADATRAALERLGVPEPRRTAPPALGELWRTPLGAAEPPADAGVPGRSASPGAPLADGPAAQGAAGASRGVPRRPHSAGPGVRTPWASGGEGGGDAHAGASPPSPAPAPGPPGGRAAGAARRASESSGVAGALQWGADGGATAQGALPPRPPSAPLQRPSGQDEAAVPRSALHSRGSGSSAARRCRELAQQGGRR